MVKLKFDNKVSESFESVFWVERLYSALDFAEKSLKHLIIDGHSAPEDAPWFVRQEKVIAETAYLMVFAKTYCHFEKINEKLNSLAGVLKPLARSEAMLLNICLKPTLAYDYAHSHICLNFLGYSDTHFDRILKKALASSAANGIERTPYRKLEIEWLKSIGTRKVNQKTIKKWINLSCLSCISDVFNESTESVYALTHAVMYSTFNGNEIDEKLKNRILRQIEVLLVRYMDLQDYDIAGELLLAWIMLGEPLTPVIKFCLDTIIKIEKRVGFLPAPGLDLAMIEGKELIQRRTYIYSINYHTVLVMGLLSALLSENAVETINKVEAEEYPIELKKILTKEVLNSKPKHWIEYFNEADTANRKSLVSFIITVAICRAVQEKKFALLQKLISTLSQTAFVSSLVYILANELLGRLSLIAEK